MKNKFTLTVVAVIFWCMATAQAPEKFNYQAVARDGAGAILANQNLGVRMTVRSGSSVGSIVYRETHTVTTNQFGLFTLAIGGGTPTLGTVAAIDWSSNSYFAETEIDPIGGTNYTSVGAAQLLSVPYALYAKDGGPWKRTGNNISNTNTGNVGIGITTPSAALHVVDSANTTLVTLKKGGRTSGPAEMLKIETDSINIGSDLISLSVPASAPANSQFIEFERGSGPVATINTNGDFDTDGEYQRDQTGAANVVPIAYGNVSGTGVINTGSGNFSVTRTGAGSYTITITGETYFYMDYTTLVTVNTTSVAAMSGTNSLGGNLLVKTFNSSGTATDYAFQFVVYKP